MPVCPLNRSWEPISTEVELLQLKDRQNRQLRNFVTCIDKNGLILEIPFEKLHSERPKSKLAGNLLRASCICIFSGRNEGLTKPFRQFPRAPFWFARFMRHEITPNNVIRALATPLAITHLVPGLISRLRCWIWSSRLSTVFFGVGGRLCSASTMAWSVLIRGRRSSFHGVLRSSNWK